MNNLEWKLLDLFAKNVTTQIVTKKMTIFIKNNKPTIFKASRRDKNLSYQITINLKASGYIKAFAV